jgi:conjugative transposon TraN protein
MKKLIILTAIVIAALQSFAQKINLADGVRKSDLPVIYLPDSLSVHFISPEPIQYVDISSSNIVGDLPVKNVLRIKYRTDSAKRVFPHDAVVTIIGEKFMAQYHVIYSPEPQGGAIQTDVEINPADTRPLDFPGISLSQPELKQYAFGLLDKRPEKHLAHSKAYGIRANLNHAYTLGDYIFLDLGFENSTNLSYIIDAVRFKINDKKVTKASTVQSLEIKPDFTLLTVPTFKKHYRNIFVFKKFTFPGNKVLQIEMSEQQLSGRVITLDITYKDVLEADTIPLP